MPTEFRSSRIVWFITDQRKVHILFVTFVISLFSGQIWANPPGYKWSAELAEVDTIGRLMLILTIARMIANEIHFKAFLMCLIRWNAIRSVWLIRQPFLVCKECLFTSGFYFLGEDPYWCRFAGPDVNLFWFTIIIVDNYQLGGNQNWPFNRPASKPTGNC